MKIYKIYLKLPLYIKHGYCLQKRTFHDHPLFTFFSLD